MSNLTNHKRSDSLSRIIEPLCPCPALIAGMGCGSRVRMELFCCLRVPLNWALCTVLVSFSSVMYIAMGPGTIHFRFRFRFGENYHLTFGKYSASPKSRTPLLVLLSVSAESEICNFGRPLENIANRPIKSLRVNKHYDGKRLRKEFPTKNW